MLARLFSLLLVSGLLAVAAAACSDGGEDGATPSFDGFRAELDEGASCGRLYEIRNELKDHKDPNIELMNDELLRIGCLLSTDDRTDGERPPGTEGLEPINYSAAYDVCSHRSEETYQQSGTNDAGEAARWLAEGSRAGVARDSSYQGCLDGLLGEPNRFGQ
jgi:hypothetical protein